jgi:hypothetical protein
MKKVILLNLALISVALLHGQTIKNEVENAEKLLKQKNYKEAVQELKNAIAVIENEQLNTMKTDLLPEKVLEYSKANSDENMESSSKSYISGNRIEIAQSYSKPIGNVSSNSETSEGFMGQNISLITINISNVPGKMCDIANAHSMNSSEGFEMESIVPTAFKGYRAIKLYSADARHGKYAVIIGGAVLEINAENIENEKILLEAVNSIDIEKIIQYFGK